MELNNKIIEIKDIFCKTRNTDMSDEEFVILLISFPAFQVANADNDFDDEERSLLSTLLYNFLNEIYEKELNKEQYENLISSYLNDYLWINEHKEWENKLLSNLSVLSNDIEGLDDTVINMMKEIAEVSDGVSQEEEDMIETITDILEDIDDLDEL